MTTRIVAVLIVLWGSMAGVPARAADAVADGQWFHQFLNTRQAYTVTQGDGVTVAVVDSGVDASHPDLTDSVVSGIDLTASDGDGRIDSDGHGTAMAGLVVASGRVEGIAPRASVLPIRAGSSGELASDRVAQGIRWAVANGAKVVSVSLAAQNDDLLLRQEVQAAQLADVVVVAAVGNRPDDTGVQYPAAIPGVVAVAGVDKNGNHSTVSVIGPEVVIAAPSDNISSTDKGGGYRVGTGTSDATAIVAGAVALIRSKYPNLKATEVVRRLTATATDKGPPGRDPQYGYGVLNLVAALTADLPQPTTAAPTKVTTTPPPPTTPSQFPWWLLAVLPLTAAAIAIVVWARLYRRR